MTTVLVLLLVAGAAYAAAGPKILAEIRKAFGLIPKVEGRHVAGAALLAAAALVWSNMPAKAPPPAPSPAPAPAALDLRGKFVGPTAAADAAVVAALLEELAAELEWDGTKPEDVRLIKTGQAVGDLRTRARELRCRGESLGARHPLVRDAIQSYLDAAAGTAGGPLTPAQRAAWVAAYREISKAAANVAR
jgi:hypothetical protein